MNRIGLITLISFMLAISPAYAIQVDENTTLATFGGAFNYTFSEQMNFTIVGEYGDHITLNYTNFSIYPLTGTGSATIVQVEDTLINFTVCASNEVNMSFENLSTGIDLYIVEDDVSYENITDNQNITFNAASCKEINILFLDNDITVNSPENTTYYNLTVQLNITTNTTSTCQYSLDGGNYTEFPDLIYQETENSHYCTGTWTPTHPCSDAHDGDWGTYARVLSGSGYLFENYTIPSSEKSGSYWFVKSHIDSTSYNASENLSLDTCITDAVIYSGVLQLKVLSSYNGCTYWSDHFCYNGSSWELLRHRGYGSADNWANIYEDGVWFNLSESRKDFIVSTPNLTREQHNVTFKCYDGIEYINETVYFSINSIPTAPTSLNLTDPVYVTDRLTANCSGSTDADGDSIAYYYEFYNVNDTAIVQAYSISENYTIQATDARDNITVSCKAYDGVEYSTSINENISVSYNTINITVQDIYNSTINNFSITLESDDYPYLDTQNTTTGSLLFYLNNNSDYTFIVDAAGYAIENVTITSNETEHNYTFYLYTDNSISFTFKDELTDSIIDYANISIELISDLFASNYSTENGTLYVDSLPIGEYIIRYDAEGYSERVYYFTLVNRTHSSLTLYLLNDSSTTEVTATVYDQNNNLLEDVYIKVLKYDLTTNSYLVQEIVKTNFEGEATMHIVLNSEFYKFLLEYDSEIVKETTPSYIYATTLTFQVLIGEAYGEDFYNNNDISHHIIFNNDTNNFRYTYSDPNNLLESSCLKVWRSSIIGDILLNTTCVNSSSGTILIGVTNSSGTTYKASAYIYREGEEFYMSSLWKSFVETILSSKTALFYITILVILMGFIGAWNVPVAVILTPLGLIFGALVGFVDISMMYLIPLEILAVIIAYMISKKS